MKNLELTQSPPQASRARDGGRKREGVKEKVKTERANLTSQRKTTNNPDLRFVFTFLKKMIFFIPVNLPN
ncbi:hypothetical protein Q5P01_023219 [Channa striata]|uniref:Uncharacterized protein n=1 Tax=Channa striata TaxID=64152 RepID=A0AA88IUH1_CHASR|nr:hypothetical protein Q5P01_023219 [Channa striata]